MGGTDIEMCFTQAQDEQQCTCPLQATTTTTSKLTTTTTATTTTLTTTTEFNWLSFNPDIP